MFPAPESSLDGSESLSEQRLATLLTSRKRKITNYGDLGDEEEDWDHVSPKKKLKNELEGGGVQPTVTPKSRRKKKSMDADCEIKQEEKRLRRFRQHPPQSYLQVKERALTQRLIIQSRERCGTDEVPEEKVTIVGTTGNLYTVKVSQVPSCNCPHARKGNQCKHIIYVMLRVLKAPEHIAYQLALTSSELRDLFKRAPPIPDAENDGDDANGNRKPIEGDCPICCTELEPTKEALVYCKQSCGHNFHKSCMSQWIKTKAGKGTCPYCRATWEETDIDARKVDIKAVPVNEEGYINVASQLGLSGERDVSTYHQYWVRTHYRRQQRWYGGDD
ncbi:uncharacterized protein EI97DRAFT_400576 [Westerdykella ornata]|uniref:Uncharacterized protein n=1 Tax=Westerdykella ornata TaxID=318751 RepID=A0A6A6JFP3_WESOR|nr:uncharacterized protein EI97DRAFT_400576 [Westerdykella ornata]KAF2275147.1 hypothetical protein EI97DRAFT_400576 [Westerdykella ornata]